MASYWTDPCFCASYSTWNSTGERDDLPSQCGVRHLLASLWNKTGKLTASGDTTVGLWDVTSGVAVNHYKYHSASVKSVDSDKDDPNVFASGGRDGDICIWDTRCLPVGSNQRPVNRIHAAHKPTDVKDTTPKKTRGSQQLKTDPTLTVTAVKFCGSDKLISAGSTDGLVKMWDLRRNYSGCKASPPRAWCTFDPVTSSRGKVHGFSSLACDSHRSFVYATSRNNVIYKYNTAGLITRPVEAFSGGDISSFYVKSCLSPDDQFLLSGSTCGRTFIWEVNQPRTVPLLLSTVSTEVTAVDWCPAGLDKLATCSMSNDIRVWRVNRGQSKETVVGTCREYNGICHYRGRWIMKELAEEKEAAEPAQHRSPLRPINTWFSSVSPPTNMDTTQTTPPKRHNDEIREAVTERRTPEETCEVVVENVTESRKRRSPVSTKSNKRGRATKKQVRPGENGVSTRKHNTLNNYFHTIPTS